MDTNLGCTLAEWVGQASSLIQQDPMHEGCILMTYLSPKDLFSQHHHLDIKISEKEFGAGESKHFNQIKQEDIVQFAVTFSKILKV